MPLSWYRRRGTENNKWVHRTALRAGPRAGPRRRLQVEPLEDRCVLSAVSDPLLPTADGPARPDVIGYASGSTVFATAGQPVTAAVAHVDLFVNATLLASLSFQDGSLGVLRTTATLPAGSYDLIATHTYGQPGVYDNWVTLTIPPVSSLSLTSIANVAPQSTFGAGGFDGRKTTDQTPASDSSDTEFVPTQNGGAGAAAGAGPSIPIFGSPPPRGQGAASGSSQGELTGQIAWVRYPDLPPAPPTPPLNSGPQTELQVRRLQALSFLTPLALDGPSLLVPGALRARAQQAARRQVPIPAQVNRSVPTSETIIPAVVLAEEDDAFDDTALAVTSFTPSESDPSAPARALGHDLTPARIPLLGRVNPRADDTTIRAEEDDEPVTPGLPAAYFGLLEPSKETDPDETLAPPVLKDPNKHDARYSGLLLAVYLFLVLRTLRGN